LQKNILTSEIFQRNLKDNQGGCFYCVAPSLIKSKAPRMVRDARNAQASAGEYAATTINIKRLTMDMNTLSHIGYLHKYVPQRPQGQYISFPLT
jgi:hypothetical protein